MLDVHAPHEATHSWKDFFIHIATICVGLLIAVGLEQAVEAVHRSHERAELRESLQHETEQILRDTERVEKAMSGAIAWHEQFGDVLIAAANADQPLGKLPQIPGLDFDVPTNPIYKAAKAGNKLPLLTQEETEAYAEIDGLLTEVVSAYDQREAALRAENETLSQLRFSQPSLASKPDRIATILASLPGLKLPVDDLSQLHKDTLHIDAAAKDFRFWSRQTRGAAKAMSEGERDLHKIEAAERQFNNLP